MPKKQEIEQQDRTIRVGIMVTYEGNGGSEIMGIVAAMNASLSFSDTGSRVEEVDVFPIAIREVDSFWRPFTPITDALVRKELSEVTFLA